MTTPRKPHSARTTRPAAKASEAPVAAPSPVEAVPEAESAAAVQVEAAPAAVIVEAASAAVIQPEAAPEIVAPVPETPAVAAPAARPAPKTLNIGEFAMTTQTIESGFTAAKEQFDKFASTFFTSYEDFASFGKDNVEAIVKAQTALVKGTEELSKTIVALSQAHFETAVSTSKALFTATTINQVVELQNEATKSSLEKIVTEGNKVGELVQKVANEVVEPIKARVDVAMQKAMKPAA